MPRAGGGVLWFDRDRLIGNATDEDAPISRVTGSGNDHIAALVRLASTSRLAPLFGTPQQNHSPDIRGPRVQAPHPV